MLTVKLQKLSVRETIGKYNRCFLDVTHRRNVRKRYNVLDFIAELVKVLFGGMTEKGTERV